MFPDTPKLRSDVLAPQRPAKPRAGAFASSQKVSNTSPSQLHSQTSTHVGGEAVARPGKAWLDAARRSLDVAQKRHALFTLSLHPHAWCLLTSIIANAHALLLRLCRSGSSAFPRACFLFHAPALSRSLICTSPASNNPEPQHHSSQSPSGATDVGDISKSNRRSAGRRTLCDSRCSFKTCANVYSVCLPNVAQAPMSSATNNCDAMSNTDRFDHGNVERAFLRKAMWTGIDELAHPELEKDRPDRTSLPRANC